MVEGDRREVVGLEVGSEVRRVSGRDDLTGVEPDDVARAQQERRDSRLVGPGAGAARGGDRQAHVELAAVGKRPREGIGVLEIGRRAPPENGYELVLGPGHGHAPTMASSAGTTWREPISSGCSSSLDH